MKKLVFAAMALLLLCLLCGAALADTVYTVSLVPGDDGIGQPIIYRSSDQEVIPSWRSYNGPGFYTYDDGSMMFCFDPQTCPDGWTARQEGYEFDKFQPADDNHILTQANTTFIAKWKMIPKNTFFVLSPTAITLDSFDDNGYMCLYCNLDPLCFESETGIEIVFNAGMLTSGINSLDFGLYESNDFGDGGSYAFCLDTNSMGGVPSEASFNFLIHIAPNALEKAAPGVYTGSLNYSSTWCPSLDNGDSGSIALTLVVPGVTVNGGTGSGKYEEGASVTITANASEDGLRFAGWTGANGLTFTSGSAATPTATFIMPAGAVVVTATYKATVIVNGGIGGGDYSAGDAVTITANVPEAGKLFGGWEGADELTFTSGSAATATATFTMPARDVELTATYEDVLVSSYALSVPGVTITPDDIFTPVTATISELSMITGSNGKTPVRLRVIFNSGTLVNVEDSTERIPFRLSSTTTSTASNQCCLDFTSTDSKTFYIRIENSSWDSATPGTYAGTMGYIVRWLYSDKTWSGDIETGSIPVTVTVLPPQAYTVTVNGGTTDKAFAVRGESITITANEPEPGKHFAGWTSADNLTFTSGSTATATATFTMPAYAVEITATYEDNPKYAVTVNNGTGGGEYEEGESVTITANDPEPGKRFAGWTVPDGLTFTSGSAATVTATFSMPDHAVELTATYEDVPYTLALPAVVTVVPGAQYVAVDSSVTALSLETDSYGNTPTFLRLIFNGLTLTNQAGQTISCQLRKNASDTPANMKMFNVYSPGGCGIEIVIPSTAWAGVVPGTYTGTIQYIVRWRYSNSWSGDIETGTIPVTVTIPAFGTPDFTLPNDLLTIEANAFEGIAASIVDVPDGCTAIGDHAFRNCPNLTQIRIPASVTDIGTDIFSGCTHNVCVYGTAGSAAQAYCSSYNNCLFVPDTEN